MAWGSNGSRESEVPAELTNGIAQPMAIAAGATHSLALRNDGTVLAWGDNSYGQTNAVSGLEQVKLIAAGADFSLASVLSRFLQQ